MTAAPLIDALRRKADEDADALWRNARADADGHRATLLQRAEEQRNAEARQLARKTDAFARAATSEAEGTARRNMATAKAALADRLHSLAVEALPELKTMTSFAALAAELPARSWQRVIVHPDDRIAARSAFPQAEVIGDPAIAGGMTVEDGAVCISNTFEARLESGWPEILPALMKEIVGNAGVSPAEEAAGD